MSVTNWTTFRVLFMFTLLPIGLYNAFTQLQLFTILIFGILGIIIVRLGNIGYHRWLTHKQFEPHDKGRLIMLTSMLLSGLTPPGHYVHAHLNHHKFSDQPGDPHSPKELGKLRYFLGRYAPTGTVFMRYYMQQKDAVALTKNYWDMYIAIWALLMFIQPWLLVLLVFMFCWGWIGTLYLNWAGHGGTKGEPTNLGFFSNIFLGGEDYHANHHENPGKLLMGKNDFSAKYIIPWLSK